MPIKPMLVQNQKTCYKIVLSRDASPAEQHAAEELKSFLHQISGAVFPICFTDESTGDCEILVGNSSRLSEIGFEINFDSLGREGFQIKTVGNRLIIAGGRPRGTLYAAYTFLEDNLGCRWFTPTVSQIPKRNSIELPCIDDKQVPVLEYRDPFCLGNLDTDWHSRNKSNTMHALLPDSKGYKVDYYPFVHSFDALVPVAEYFDTHPEYFSEVNGVRIKERTQLCLTNPDVLCISIDRVREWILTHPKISIVSISQNDWANPCQCENCKAIDDLEESNAGSLINFVNQIAKALGNEFPDVAFDTLAYQYTRKAPKSIRPLCNVIVRLCSIECCFSHPLSECNHIASFGSRDWVRKGFAADLVEWAKVCDRLHIWDYTTNFAHYLNPFPDFYVLQPNIKFFIDNHVTGVFEEGNNSTGEGGELNALRQYVLARLLWNPDINVDIAIGEFLTGVYGMAARHMRQYFDLIHDQVADKDVHMGIYDSPKSSYLNEAMLDKADQIFDDAERVADNEEILARVRLARLSIRYVRLNIMPLQNPLRASLVEEFAKDLAQAGFTEIWESHPLSESIELLANGILETYNT